LSGPAVERLAAALCRLRQKAGQPPLKELVHQAGRQRPPVQLTTSALSEWFNAHSVPRSAAAVLRAIGVQVTLGRNTALMEMAGEMPASVITKLLGISLHRATRWTQDAGNTPPGYAMDVARRGTP
jgi:hypothetical protein